MSNKTGNCYHCHLPLPPEGEEYKAEIKGEELKFCCNGCKSVCEAIYSSGMDGFYRRTSEETQLQPPPEIDSQLAMYDLDEVQEEFVNELTPVREIHLLVEGIHCAACVWLIENSLSKIEGILEANVNLSAKKLRLKWDNESIKLSQVLSQLGKIGYAAVPFDPEKAEGQIAKQNRQMLYRLGFAAFTAMNLMWISIALYAGADEGEYKALFQWLGFALSTPTLIFSAFPFFHSAITGLINRHLTMDLPIAIGASITYLYSCYVLFFNVELGDVYFDTVVNFIFVILTGRYLEAISKKAAVSSTQRLYDLQPKVATRLESGEQKLVPIKALVEGDRVLVKAGERIPVDGVIVEGSSKIDESMLSGESHPISKKVSAPVYAGTNNKDGVLTVEVANTLKQTALGKIINLVDQAQSSKAPIQCTADKIVPWFVSITLILAVVTFIFWFQSDFEKALMAATSVLIITCPCAFGLATPMAMAVATGIGARLGILIKHGAVLEILSSIKHFVFDKTGTLTEGKIQVTHLLDEQLQEYDVKTSNLETLSSSSQEILNAAYLLENYSEHPLARAVVHFVEENELPCQKKSVENIEVIAGQGILGKIDGQSVAIGNKEFVQTYSALDKKLEQQAESYLVSGSSVIYCYQENHGVLILVVEDRLRDEAAEVVQQLKSIDVEMALLSGDKQSVAEHTARQVGIAKVTAEVLPEQKESEIRLIQEKGYPIAMVGDGINDAPALARADIGIAMGSGTDVSIDSADIILTNGELSKIPISVELSRKTLTTIKQNIGLSILYNIIMVPLAMAALVTPLVAAIAMPISSLLVIANAARLKLTFK